METCDLHELIWCVSEDCFSVLLCNHSLDIAMFSSYLLQTINRHLNELCEMLWQWNLNVDFQNENDMYNHNHNITMMWQLKFFCFLGFLISFIFYLSFENIFQFYCGCCYHILKFGIKGWIIDNVTNTEWNLKAPDNDIFKTLKWA